MTRGSSSYCTHTIITPRTRISAHLSQLVVETRRTTSNLCYPQINVASNGGTGSLASNIHGTPNFTSLPQACRNCAPTKIAGSHGKRASNKDNGYSQVRLVHFDRLRIASHLYSCRCTILFAPRWPMFHRLSARPAARCWMIPPSLRLCFFFSSYFIAAGY